MPLYTFRDEETGIIHDIQLSLAEREEFLKTYPHMKQIITSAPAIGDPVRLGRRHHDDNFNDVLKSIKKANRHSTIETRN